MLPDEIGEARETVVFDGATGEAAKALPQHCTDQALPRRLTQQLQDGAAEIGDLGF
jgi:hypothetical protein